MLRALTNPSRNSSQWFDPHYKTMFNTSIYAPYMHGGGYLLSQDLASAVLAEARSRLMVDDLMLTRLDHVSVHGPPWPLTRILFHRALDPSVQVTSVEDALVGALLFHAQGGAVIRDVRYYDLARLFHSWARVGDQTGVNETLVCTTCGGPDMLVVHPLKLAATQQVREPTQAFTSPFVP